MAKIFRPRGIEDDGLKYYQEQDKHGDYVAVDPETLEARATAIGGLRSSVCTTGVSLEFLNTKCHRVRKADIPKEWLDVL